ncbi:hypothetical protein ACNQFZ_19910 [Schinkia sp. CFF1]
MGWFIFFGILMYFFWQRENYEADEFERRGETIGEEKRENGYIYFNIGDIDNNEYWILNRKYEPIYYVNVYEDDDTYEIVIEDNFSMEALESEECEAEFEAILSAKSFYNFYSSYGTVIMNYEQIDTLKMIMRADRYFGERYEVYMEILGESE